MGFHVKPEGGVFRVISRLTEEGLQPRVAAIARKDSPCSRLTAIFSRSSLERWV
jgi:hypothetical protein